MTVRRQICRSVATIALGCLAFAGGVRAEDTPLAPAPIMIDGAPPPRKIDEVKAVLGQALSTSPDATVKPLRIVLCASEKDPAHNKPGYHDYPLWRTRWTKLLGQAKGIQVEEATDWPTSEQWKAADVIAVNSWNPAWFLERDAAKITALGEQIDAFLARGGGLVFIHYALNAGPNAPQLASRLGLAWTDGSKPRGGAKDWVLNQEHPLAAGFTTWENPDESYWNMKGDLKAAHGKILATSLEENAPQPQMWTREVGKGRVFVCVPGHFTWTYDDPLYRILVFRGMMWTAKEPIDRLAPIVLVGARVAP